MVYYYHSTKDDLFLAVVETIYGKLTEDIAAAVGGDGPVEERLRQLYERLAALSEDELTVVRIVVREALTSSERLKRLVAERFLSGHVPLMAGLLADGISERRFTEQHHPMVLGLAMLSLGLLPQIILRRLPREAVPFIEPPEPGEAARSLADVLLRGIARRDD